MVKRKACMVCQSLIRATSEDAVFFLGYVLGAEDAGALRGEEHAMCEDHARMRDNVLEDMEDIGG